MADDAEKRSRERLEAIRKAKAEGTLGSSSSSRGRKGPGKEREKAASKGLVSRAASALSGRQRQIDSIVDHASRGGDERQGKH